ncbi:hypothetical protein R9C62_002712 [Enterobacter hormaechei]|nr:hypothetical protein [Enterobacter hormaechei]
MKRICKKPHRHDSMFDALSDNQGNIGRHKCCGCAYDKGMWHAMIGVSRVKNDSVLEDLPESQAGHVRHKDAFEAYNSGYDHGLRIRKIGKAS